MKNILIILFILSYSYIFSQVNEKIETNVKGEIKEAIKDKDSINFTNYYLINKKYYETYLIGSIVNDGRFNFKLKLSYPHMYIISYTSEKNIIPFRGGEYFIDNLTNFITINTAGECSELNGYTNNEFRTKFIPFFYNEEEYDCKINNIQGYRFLKGADFDQKLFEYIKDNPNSFVALWYLIERFSANGYTKLYEDALNSFSTKMQSQKIWKLLDEDIRNIRIKKYQVFPNLDLKTVELDSVKLKLPKAKYILVDYWFSTCAPCLKSFPKYKGLFNKYHSKGFEIIGISVDNTKNINKWKNVIIEKDLNWIQYLDENRVEAKKDNISKFPTTFLLNEKGEIIIKNISLEELEIILKENLKN